MEYLSNEVGRCDREIKCGNHYTPKMYFKDNNLQNTYTPIINKHRAEKKMTQISYHPTSEVKLTLKNYSNNNLTGFLYSKFHENSVSKMINDYRIGTSNDKFFGTVFWQIDTKGKVRGGKIISYDKKGHRTKYINWIHAIQLKNNIISKFHLKQCLFGLHLLKDCNKTIAIVESEKTACIMSMLFQKYIWMASGSINGLNKDKLEDLKGCKIILYPDLGIQGKNGSPYTQWKERSEKLKNQGFNIEVSDLLEKKATIKDRERGLDIADYFIDFSQNKPKRIISKQNDQILKMYMKNKKLKTLIDVFDLRDVNGNTITF
ncbi:hypothetical protein JM658_16160 [Joostella atrarenae]|uniref:Toprim domain-containing protein n=2 Tax=Joostella atrarenae TaxID=679257 RepID=A0ABS9J7G0_9FLAO|nr:hypothetical protein [Joostella atrarenae]